MLTSRLGTPRGPVRRGRPVVALALSLALVGPVAGCGSSTGPDATPTTTPSVSLANVNQALSTAVNRLRRAGYATYEARLVRDGATRSTETGSLDFLHSRARYTVQGHDHGRAVSSEAVIVGGTGWLRPTAGRGCWVTASPRVIADSRFAARTVPRLPTAITALGAAQGRAYDPSDINEITGNLDLLAALSITGPRVPELLGLTAATRGRTDADFHLNGQGELIGWNASVADLRAGLRAAKIEPTNGLPDSDVVVTLAGLGTPIAPISPPAPSSVVTLKPHQTSYAAALKACDRRS